MSKVELEARMFRAKWILLNTMRTALGNGHWHFKQGIKSALKELDTPQDRPPLDPEDFRKEPTTNEVETNGK